MRPDTEPNLHAKRIMAGAVILTAGSILVYSALWAVEHTPTIILGVTLISLTGIVSYVLGTVAIDILNGGH